MKSQIVVSFVGLSLFCFVGCGGNDSQNNIVSDGGQNVVCSMDRSRLLVDLSTSELAAFCDCAASLGGGYGQVKNCAGGVVVKTPVDRTSCVAGESNTKASCTATADVALSCAAELQQCTVGGTACLALLPCYATDAGL